jgi:hypothetical protein
MSEVATVVAWFMSLAALCNRRARPTTQDARWLEAEGEGGEASM